MSETLSTDEDQAEIMGSNPLETLKQRARLMGIPFSNNIGLEALRAKVNEKLAEPTPGAPEEPITKPAAPGKVKSERELAWENSMKLVRLRIANMDPKKKDLPGEIITVANDVVGSVRKFIPFGEASDDGYHVPYILYEFMRDREFLHTRSVKMSNGFERVEQRWMKEFNLEVLPQLTLDEVNRLANAQAAAGVFASE